MRGAAILLAAAALVSASEKPNILLIHVDSLDGRIVTDPDSPALMPNWHRLSNEGTTFVNTYAASPECNPSRSTLWSGRRVDHVKTWNNGKALPVQYPIIFDHLWDQGWDEYFIGRRDFNMYGDSFQPKHAAEAPMLHHSLTANLSAWLRAVPGLNIPFEMRPNPHVSSDTGREVHAIDWQRAASAAKWLQDRKANGTTKPFALSVGFIVPHPAYVTDKYWAENGVNQSRVKVPEYRPPSEAPWPLAYDSISKNVTYWGMDYWTDDELKEVRSVYAAMAAESDAIVGTVLDALDETGYANNTVVVAWSDHGDLQMQHLSWYKESVLEGSARVPLVIRGPGMAKGKRVERATSLLDIAPTVFDVTGTPYPSGELAIDGYSLVPDLMEGTEGGTPPHPDYVISQWHGDHGNTGQFAIRSGDLKYIYYAPFVPKNGVPTERSLHNLPPSTSVPFGQAFSMLFNISDDPDEMKDISQQQPAAAQKLHDTLLSELGDMDAIDREVKAWDKCMWSKWRSETGHGNVTRVLDVMGNHGNRFWWVWRSDPAKWFGMITDWERGNGGTNLSACVDPFYTTDDESPKHWDDDNHAAPWTFPDPLEQWPISSTISAGPEDFRRAVDGSIGAADRLRAYGHAVQRQ